MGAYTGYNISKIVDGSGLSALSFSDTHDIAANTNAWAGSLFALTGTIDFNLHGTYDLNRLAVWNFNGASTAGVKNLSILTSTDGVNYSSLVGAPGVFAQGADFASEIAQQFTFTPVTASYVRFNITSNYSSTIFTGLSEVAFGSVDVPVPEPSALALFAVGATGFAARRRRKTA